MMTLYCLFSIQSKAEAWKQQMMVLKGGPVLFLIRPQWLIFTVRLPGNQLLVFFHLPLDRARLASPPCSQFVCKAVTASSGFANWTSLPPNMSNCSVKPTTWSMGPQEVDMCLFFFIHQSFPLSPTLSCIYIWRPKSSLLNHYWGPLVSQHNPVSPPLSLVANTAYGFYPPLCSFAITFPLSWKSLIWMHNCNFLRLAAGRLLDQGLLLFPL